MAKRIPRSLYDAKFLPLWHDGRRFMAIGLRLKVDAENKLTNHYSGGPGLHKGAKCTNCRKPLTLLWDVDLRDPLIPDYVREGFSPASRLPFYICWQCVAAAYTITSDSQVRCFTDLGETLEQDETPFSDALTVLPRRRIAFETIPSTIDALRSLEIEMDEIDKEGQKILKKYYRKTSLSTWDIPFSQLGGEPSIYQRHRSAVCPNPKCPASRLEHPYGELEIPYLMKELAVIHHDHEPELAKHYFQILYYICRICFSLRAEYRCT